MRGRLPGYKRLRLKNLLDMLYTPSELAREIGVTVRQMYRVYLRSGCPSIRTANRIFINGKAFAEWYFSAYPLISMSENEGFCLVCKKPVSMFDRTLKKSGRLSYYVDVCPDCGRKITRIVDRDKS